MFKVFNWINLSSFCFGSEFVIWVIEFPIRDLIQQRIVVLIQTYISHIDVVLSPHKHWFVSFDSTNSFLLVIKFIVDADIIDMKLV